MDGDGSQHSRPGAIRPPPCASLWQLLKGLACAPPVLITDKRANDGAARREILPGVAHRRHKGLHNRAEHAH